MPTTITEQILDLARWAPSGDNTQPWRFEVPSQHHIVVHGFDTREHCVYDLDGHASQLAIGAMLETLRIAASAFGLSAETQRRSDSSEQNPVFDIWLRPDSTVARDPLFDYIKIRSVQRRPLSCRRLTLQEKAALEESFGNSYSLVWLEEPRLKRLVAKLMLDSAQLRLTIKEAYENHKEVLDFGKKFSKDKIPDQSIGLDFVTLKLMRWAFISWKRVQFFNKFLAGTLVPRFKLELLPALGCAAHFALISEQYLENIDDYIAAGRALQRFWLSATALGLQMQPEITPLIFSRYARKQHEFSTAPGSLEHARRINLGFETLIGDQGKIQRMAFFGRIGQGKLAQSRSLRLDLPNLMR